MFYTHGEIARAVSRADIGSYSTSKVLMGDYNAYVTNCRTTNAWPTDLALTSTYFPHCNLNFAIIFGCTLSVEEEILNRLSFSAAEAAHPQLLPGILVELERLRHINVVETTIDQIESHIVRLELLSSTAESISDEQAAQENNKRRDSYLDTRYLSNHLISWNTQLAKLVACTQDLDENVFEQIPSTDINRTFTRVPGIPSYRGSKTSAKTPESHLSTKGSRVRSPEEEELVHTCSCVTTCNNTKQFEGGDDKSPGLLSQSTLDGQRKPDYWQRSDHQDSLCASIQLNDLQREMPCGRPRSASYFDTGRGSLDQIHTPPSSDDEPEDHRVSQPETERAVSSNRLLRVSRKIQDRVRVIMDENNDRIRDCKMRVEGMSMATQWANGETNVQIALEMRKDSRQMKSIALVTMIFLPGTFFASFFSMTFFNWGGNGSSESTNQDSTISHWIWVYILLTASATLLTFFWWWYFLVYRPSKKRRLVVVEDEG